MVLHDICEFIVDCPHSTAPDEGFGYPLIRTPNIGKGRLNLSGVQRVSKEVYDKRNKRAVPQQDDIIFAREAPAGNAALISEGQEVCLGQRTVLIRPDKKKVYPKFLVYYILAPQQQYELLGTANGATVAHVNIPIIKNLPVELPDISQQKKIGDILYSYDDLIENNQKQIKLLEEAAQRLYKEWFVDLHFPGYETTQIIDGVPEGWTKKSVENSLEMYIGGGWGKEVPTGNNVIAGKVIRGTDINDIKAGNFKDVPLRYHTKNDINKRNLQKYDIVFELSNGNINNIGRSILIDDFILEKCGENTICASFCKLFRPLDKVHSLILYCEIQDMQNSGRMLPFKKQGSNGINNFAFEEFLNHEFLVPNDEKFIKPIDNIINLISILQNQVSELIEARDRLLLKLMSGELEV